MLQWTTWGIQYRQYIASGKPHNNMMQRDVQHKNPQTLKNASYCLEAFNNCTDHCRYRRKCKYSHDTDFQKLKKSGVCKFELKVKGNCKNSDKCKWSHQIPKPLYREKNSSKWCITFLYKILPTQNCMSVTKMLKWKQLKYTTWKPFFVTNERHHSLLQKSTNGGNKIDNKEPDYWYPKASEVNQHGTTNQQCIHELTSQCIHESTQQSALTS